MRIRRILSASLLIAALAAGTAACGSADAGENKPAMQETSTPSDSMSDGDRMSDGAGGDRMSDGAGGDRMSDGASGSASGAK